MFQREGTELVVELTEYCFVSASARTGLGVELTEKCFVSESGNGTCSVGEFKCETGAKCLPARWTCDGGKKIL